MNCYTMRIEETRPETFKHCFINGEKLEEVVRKLVGQKFNPPNWRFPIFPEADDETFIDFLGVGNAINFSYTPSIKTPNATAGRKFSLEYPEGSGSEQRGSYAMWACLKRALDEGIDILNPEYLRNFTYEDIKHIFRTRPPINPKFMNDNMNMLYMRHRCLWNIPPMLDEFGVGSFAELFEKCDYYAFEHNGKPGIVDVISLPFPGGFSFSDISYLPSGAELPFHKRAQLLVLMYQGRALSSKGALPLIQDVREIGPICDYQVPNAYRAEGILEYASELAERIDSRIFLDADSAEELEIRIQTNHVGLRLLEGINTLRRKRKQKLITTVELDFPIWEMGRKSPFNHHLTTTVAY